MSTTDNILRDLVEAVQNLSKPKTSAYDTTATVTRIEDGIAWCHIDGGVQETPVRLTIDAKAGDTVQVRVGGGSAWLTGNSSAPPTDDTKAKEAIRQAQQAAGTATKFVTDTKDGIFVHPKDDKDTGVRITDSIEIIKSKVSFFRAWIEDSLAKVRVGKEDAGHTLIDSGGMRVYGGDGTEKLANIGYGEGVNSSGVTSVAPYYELGNRIANTAIGNWSMIEGYNNEASAAYSHAEGLGCKATEYAAHAGGGGCVAEGPWSFAHGRQLTANYAAQAVVGQYNKPTNQLLFMVGTGESSSAQANGLGVDRSGNVYALGSMYSGDRAGTYSKMFVTDAVTYDGTETSPGTYAGVSIAAGGNSGSLSIPISKTGYTPVAVRGLQLNNSSASGGAGAANCCPYAWVLGSSSMSIAVHNHGSSAAKIKIIVTILYIANSAL